MLLWQGNSAFKRRQWSKAIEFYSEAISLCDTNATYYCNRAAAYLELGRYTLCQSYFSAQSISEVSTLNLAYFILCSLKQAEADCDRALLLDRKVRYLQCSHNPMVLWWVTSVALSTLREEFYWIVLDDSDVVTILCCYGNQILTVNFICCFRMLKHIYGVVLQGKQLWITKKHFKVRQFFCHCMNL